MPIEWIIGGREYAGKGWMMLMGCLAAGRSISLPTSSVGGAKALARADRRLCAGAHVNLRRRSGNSKAWKKRSAASPPTAT